MLTRLVEEVIYILLLPKLSSKEYNNTKDDIVHSVSILLSKPLSDHIINANDDAEIVTTVYLNEGTQRSLIDGRREEEERNVTFISSTYQHWLLKYVRIDLFIETSRY